MCKVKVYAELFMIFVLINWIVHHRKTVCLGRRLLLHTRI